MNHAGLIAITLLAGSSTMYAAVDPVSNWNAVAIQATLTAGRKRGYTIAHARNSARGYSRRVEYDRPSL